MKDVIKKAIDKALLELSLPECTFVVEHPRDLAHGDYACNVALVAAKAAGKSPREVAEILLATLQSQIPYIDKVEIAGPGFLNFHLSPTFFHDELARITDAKDNWGRGSAAVGEEVLFEYTSPNLFKPLHIGNLVGNIIGEACTRLFESEGAVVRRLNYPSDIGLTVAKGVWGLRNSGKNPEDILALGEAYRIGNEAYENDEAAKGEIEAINRSLYAADNAELSDLRERGVATSKKSLLEICDRLGTHFDAEIPESLASQPGIEIVKNNLGKVFTESNGAVVYEGEKVGLHTRVFLNSQGLPTYEAKDLGNFARKQTLYPNWTTSIIVTGNEQTEYFKVLYAAIRELFPETADRKLEHIPTGFLTLTTGKMSSRKGNVLTGESLLEEMREAARERASASRADDIEILTNQISVAAIKYQILRQSVGSNIVFDKEKALSFEGDSGPYLQYTYARANSVLEKAREAGVLPSGKVAPTVPYALERLLYRFPEVIEEALVERAPHTVVTYLTELAGAFNAFYAKEQIADNTDIYAPYKAMLTAATALTLKNGLWTLGIEAPERM